MQKPVFEGFHRIAAALSGLSESSSPPGRCIATYAPDTQLEAAYTQDFNRVYSNRGTQNQSAYNVLHPITGERMVRWALGIGTIILSNALTHLSAWMIIQGWFDFNKFKSSTLVTCTWKLLFLQIKNEAHFGIITVKLSQ